MAKLYVAAIASGAFFANPAWGLEGLPRSVDGSPIVNRWIQPGESFFLNPDHWVQNYQHYAQQVGGTTIEVDLPEPIATDSVTNPEPAPDQVPEPKPAPKKPSKPKAKPAPAPEAPLPPAEPAPDQVPDQADQAPEE